jgi:transposase-like protein
MTSRHSRPVPAPPSAFTGFRFLPDVIVPAVRWYIRFGLSYCDVEELLAERGIEVDHMTIYRLPLGGAVHAATGRRRPALPPHRRDPLAGGLLHEP